MRISRSNIRCTVAFLLLLETASTFYLPGVAPTSYAPGEKVPVLVNRLTPAESERDPRLHSVFSYDYYHPGFNFCKPEDGPKPVSESLGSILFGDRIYTSPFELKMLENETCKALCAEKEFDTPSAKFVNRRIWQNYKLNWLVDGLPAGQPYINPASNKELVVRGFPLGVIDKGKPYLNNHYDILLDYHEAENGGNYRVVGVLVEPSSRRDSKSVSKGKAECEKLEPLELNEDGRTRVTWTYSVYWRKSSTAFSTRWDSYLQIYDPQVHWFSLVSSAIFLILLCGMVAAILMRALKKDIARYNRLDSYNLDDLSGTNGDAEDGIQEDSGWKLVHGDVMRTPKNPLLLSVFLGNGAQLFIMTGITLIFALFGFLSPSNRGSLSSAMFLLYTIFGFVGGYVSARVYKTFGGDAWKVNIMLTPVLVPGFVFGTFFLLNFFVWFKGSSGAVPFTTMLVVLAIWFVISVPLSFAGSWVGFRHPVSNFSHTWPFSDRPRLHIVDAVIAGSTTCSCQSNPTPNPSSFQISPTYPIYGFSRYPSFWGNLRGAALYHEQYVVGESLLHVWLLVLMLRYYDFHLCCGDHSPGLLLALWRELPLAVEGVHGSRGFGCLCFRICAHLLGYSDQLQ